MLDIAEAKGKIDFGIITVREDEFRAILQRFPKHDVTKKNRHYAISYLPTIKGSYYSIASVACTGEGHKKGQKVAQQVIDDLDPNWLLLVGIGGGVPDYEFTLGDVVAATRFQDFAISADVEGQERQHDLRGGEMHPAVTDILKFLPAMDSELQGWNETVSISVSRPPVQLRPRNFYGDEQWQVDLKKKMKAHFGAGVPSRPPKVVTGPVASSDILLKNTETLKIWLKSARKVHAVEMELAGVYEAAQTIHRHYPILAIRGLSDIVGLKRNPAWTEYACHSAAAFAHQLLKTGFNDARASGFVRQQILKQLKESEAGSKEALLNDPSMRTILELSKVSSIVDIFRREYVTPGECDQVCNHLKQIKQSLRLEQKYLHQEYALKERADKLISDVNAFRRICRAASFNTQTNRKQILSDLQRFSQDLNTVLYA